MHRKAPVVLIGLALVLAACAVPERPETSEPAAQPVPSIDPSALEDHMRFLADDSLEGRRAGTEGFAWAAEYVAGRFDAIGLEPAGEDGYFQRVSLRRGIVEREASSLSLSRDGRPIEAAMLEDYYLRPRYLTEVSTVTAPVVYAGFGITAPEFDHDDLVGIDLEGKIAAVFSGAPESFPHNERAYYSSSEQKLGGLIERGAIGILFLTDEEDLGRYPWERRTARARMPGMRWIDDDGMVRDAYDELRVVGVLNISMLEPLFSGTSHSVEQVLEAKKKGKAASFDLGLEAAARTVTRLSDVTSPNVAGRLAGEDPELASEHVVMTAHLDHVGTSDPIDGDGIYNGAYDNASGIAVLIETARALSSMDPGPRRSVIFLAVTAEEMGLLGAERFADSPTVPADSIVANVNVDMVLMLHPLEDVIAFGAEHSSIAAPLEAAVDRIGIEVSPDPYPDEVIFIRSDQYAFVKKGIPSVFLVPGQATGDPEIDGGAMESEWLRSVYHTPKDDMEQEFDFTAGADFTRLSATLVRLVADDPRRPSWNEGDFFGAKFGN